MERFRVGGLRSWVGRVLFGGVNRDVRTHIEGMVNARVSRNRLSGRFHAAKLQRKYGLFVNPKAVFPETLHLPHPTGIVIGEGVVIGERVSLYQNVTLGGARVGDWQAGNYPEIGDDTVVFAGAVIVGAVKVGRHCVVGANSVVTKDVPDYTTVAGVPARVLKTTSPESEIV